MNQWEVVIGIETHAQLATVKRRFFPALRPPLAPSPTRRPARSTSPCPACCRCSTRRRGRVRHPLRPGDRRRSRAEIGFCPQELLLPGPAQGLPDQPVDLPVVVGGADHDAGRPGRQGLRESRPPDPRPPRRGCRQVAARGLPRQVRHRPQPRRHAAAGNRHRARHALVREAVAYAKALHALVRWIGICDGNMQEGSFRCDANVSVRPRAGRIRHPARDQEPQLLPLPASKPSTTRSSGRSPRSKKAARSSRPPCCSTPTAAKPG
jgi:aspartyl-tRNA(Asn)/glutamyl-tRNA(Gln) amidotransferase subunit B